MAEPISSTPPPAPVVTAARTAGAGDGTPAIAADANGPATSPAPVKALTKEEQMAAFEEDLKFNDWGHQPC